MFKKPNRNFRRKLAERVAFVDSDSEGENNAHGDTVEDVDQHDDVQPKSNLKEKKKKKSSEPTLKKSSSASKLLSFDSDEEDAGGEVFKVKKSSHNKRLVKQLKHEQAQETVTRPADSITRSADSDTKPADSEYTNTQGSSSPPPEEDTEEKIMKLREELRTLNGEEAEAVDVSEGEDEDGKAFKASLARGEIPDATMIHMIRKRRQLAREFGEFIPIKEPAPKENAKSRLVREDDNDKSEDDDDERMDFSINRNAVDRQKIRDEFLAAEHGSDREDSDQEREWEEQQIKKATSGPMLIDHDQQAHIFDAGSLQYIYGEGSNGRDDAQKNFEPFQSLSKMKNSSEITIESIKRRLKERYESIDEVHRAHVNEKKELERNIGEIEESIENCQLNCSSLEENFAFFQQTKGYVRDLIECLNEKVTSLNDLENRMSNLFKIRAVKFLSRRRDDLQDQCQAYMTSKSQVIMGPDETEARQRRVAEREARRSRRRRAREQKSITGHNDGLSSDDEENYSEISKFNTEKEKIIHDAKHLFDDVTEEFSGIDSVKGRFEDWKYKHQDSYEEAYISLCLPKLINPFIRLYLLDWNVLDADCCDIEDSDWYESLAFFCYRYDKELKKDDDAIKLLPSIVEKIVIPKITKIVDNIWDPMSTMQTSRLVNSINRLTRDYPNLNSKSKHFHLLIKAIVLKIRKCLDNDVFMPMYPKTTLENKCSPSSLFFHRQSWTCIKLLSNILSWHGILSNVVVQQMALDALLNRYIVLALMNSLINTSTIQKCQVIASTFPKQWFQVIEDDVNSTIPQLENFCRFLMHAAEMFRQLAESPEAKDNIKQISKILINIHAMDHALQLADV